MLIHTVFFSDDQKSVLFISDLQAGVKAALVCATATAEFMKVISLADRYPFLCFLSQLLPIFKLRLPNEYLFAFLEEWCLAFH